MNKKIKILSTIIFISIFVTILSIVTNKNININLKSKEKLEFNYDNSELQNLTFDKYWEDYNIEQFRPTSSTFNLYDKKDYYNNENKTIIQTVTLTSDNADPSDPNHWIGQFTNLPKKYADGTKVDYVVREVTSENSPYYVAYDSKDGLSITFNNQTNITNVFEDYGFSVFIKTKDKVYNLERYNPGSTYIGANIAGETFYLNPELDNRLVEKEIEESLMTSTANASNYGMIQEKVGNDYPETPHPYAVGSHQSWHYKYTPSSHTQELYLFLRADSWGNAYGFKFDDISTIGDETIVTSLINKKNLEVTKIWEDQGYESYRPNEVTYDIYDSNNLNEIVRTVTLNSNNQIDSNTWKLTVENLPKYDEFGQEIKYTIKERPIENYFSLNDYSDYYNGLAITFSEDTDAIINICYEKDEQTGKYKCLETYGPGYDSSTSLKSSTYGSKISNQTINIPSRNLYILYNKRLYPNNNENYKIKITNIEPIRFDNENRENKTEDIIPKSIKIKANIDDYLDVNPLYLNDDSVEVEWNYEWKGTFQNKPNSDTVRNSVNLTNVPFKKIWDDEGYESKRPSEVKFRIYNEKNLNEIVQEITLTSNNQDANDNTIWNGNFTNVPKYNEDGTEARYIIKEEDLEKYKTTYDLSDIKGFLVTIDEQTYSNNFYYFGKAVSNTNYLLEVVPKEIGHADIKKDEANGKTIFIPYDDVYFNFFYMYFNNTSNSTVENSYGFKIKNIIPTKEVLDMSYYQGTASNISHYEIINFSGDNLPESTHPFEGFSYYKYTYEPLSNSFVDADIIINKISVKDITITKNWEDQGQEDYRPNKITFDIYNKEDLNTIVKTVELTNEEKVDNYTWKKDVELPKYDSNNNEINYIFKERPIDNYETKYQATTGFKSLEVNFEKVQNTSGAPIFICFNNSNNKRCRYVFSSENTTIKVPSNEFDIILLKDYVQEVKIKSIRPIDEEVSLTDYNYSIGSINNIIEAENEDLLDFNINDHQLESDLDWHYKLNKYFYGEPNQNTDIVVNKALFKTIEVEKKWIDENYEVLRPNKIKLNVLKNNEIIKEVNLEKENDYKTTITLPKYENGQEIEYDIKEESIENYNTTYEKINNKVIITNEIILKDVVISKIDEEKNNLKGAILSIITETGNEVLEFTTEEKDTTIKLPKGQYILHEKKAPKGYLNANNITFNLDEKLTVNNEEVEKIIMIDKKQTNPITKDNINNYVKKLIFIISILLFTTIIKKNEEKN